MLEGEEEGKSSQSKTGSSKEPWRASPTRRINSNDPLAAEFRSKLEKDVPVPIAGVQTLLTVMSKSKAVTIMGIQSDLKEASDKLIQYEKEMSGGRTSISFKAGVEIFFRFATRNNDEVPDFDALKQLFCARGHQFVANALNSRPKIAELGHNFVQDGMVILTHGRSQVVTGVLKRAARTKNFTVIATEGRPEQSGWKQAETLAEAGIPVTVVLDSAVGYVMERVDIVLMGAEGVVESGGIVNKIGTCQIAMVAKVFNKPLYVAAESYKFARMYPLTQADIDENKNDQRPLTPYHMMGSSNGEGAIKGGGSEAAAAPPSSSSSSAQQPQKSIPDGITTENPACDYTPAQYISLLFTDLGILTPAAVSDELIRLYQ